MGRNLSNHSESPVRRSPRRRERSPVQHRGSRKGSSPAREKISSRGKSPRRGKLSSPVSQSPSPRTKRLRKAQAEKDTKKESEREIERYNGRGSDRGSHRERGKDREADNERKERRSGRSENDGRSGRIENDGRSGRSENDGRSGRSENDGKTARVRHARSTSPSDRHHKSRHRSRSPQAAGNARAREEVTNSREAEHGTDENESVAKMKAAEEALQTKEKGKPSFELSGKLAAETNRARGVTLLFTEPPEARKPNIRWRLYVFKGGEVLNEPLYIHRQSCYLFGRERRVADIPTDHPSCSKQHAVIQFRQVETEQPDGMMSKQVKPYVMDLGSTNKTFLNENPIEPQRYYELFEKDTLKFGNSSREYVLLHENSAE